MNNIITHDWNTYNSNLDEDFFYSSNKETNLLEEYNQLKSDYELLKKNSNQWYMQFRKNLWSLIFYQHFFNS